MILTVSNVEKIPPADLDLHAFLDNELNPEERVRVIEWLLDHPEKARELLEIQLREDLLRSAIRQSMNGELPKELSESFAANTERRHSLPKGFLVGITIGVTLTLVIVLFVSLVI